MNDIDVAFDGWCFGLRHQSIALICLQSLQQNGDPTPVLSVVTLPPNFVESVIDIIDIY